MKRNLFFSKDINKTLVKYNSDINIVGSIPDYHLIIKALPILNRDADELYKILVKENEFNLRTEKSRKRFMNALSSAFVHEEREINDFTSRVMESDEIDQDSKIIFLFWLFSINNRLFKEVNKHVFFKYYYMGRAELPAADVQAFLKDFISTKPELKSQWSEETVKTIASKYLTLLKKMNLLEGSRKKSFCFVTISDELIACLIHLYTLLGQQNSNFLEHEFASWMFISKESILERFKRLGKRDWIKMHYTGDSLKVESNFNNKNIIDGIFRRS
ncbi:DUF1819 family protein [Weeksellaceae bacterium KMM 9713]|uniref:DUF1819 family protein n=1 Tax=Profundicola chukchiensis TaxID=2961959 RepID=A0A9X4MVL0_9FLAO|nr:BrxA family protein [Profundicola chukchiensis]MDG4945711.1 DUF1819 family protein [Profundicola chukchiensis]